MEIKTHLADYITAIIIFSLVLAIPFFIWALLTQRFNIQKKAQLDTEYAELYFSPLETNAYQDDILPVNIMLTTGDSEISSISLRITYPFTGDTPELVPTDQLGNEIKSIIPNQDLLLSGSWVFPVNQISIVNNLVTIEMAAINTSTNGYKTISPIILAHFYLRADQVTNTPITLTIDKAASMVMTKSSPVANILDPSSTFATYSISVDTVAPDQVSDLTATNIHYNSLDLVWSAPNDPGPQDSLVESYEIRYSNSNITNENWSSSAILVSNSLIPQNSGQQELFNINNLDSNQTYYFALKSVDNSGNISNLSNVASAVTLPTSFSPSISLQGVSTPDLTQNFTISSEGSFNSSQFLHFTSNSLGVFDPQTPFSFESVKISDSGLMLNFFAKTNSHLRKYLGQLNIIPGDNQSPANWSQRQLLAGDFNSDNILNISDIGLMLSVYTSLSVSTDTSNKKYDVDLNEVINIADIALVLSNYTQLQVLGD